MVPAPGRGPEQERVKMKQANSKRAERIEKTILGLYDAAYNRRKNL